MHEPALVQWAPDHVEALARAGETERAEASLDRVRRSSPRARSARGRSPRPSAAAASSPAPPSSPAHFERALELHEGDGQPFERARTHLAYAERLRRVRQRAEARPHLTAALEIFDRLGAKPWVGARARPR